MYRKLAALALTSAAAFAPLVTSAAHAQMPSPEKIHKAWDKNADGGIDKAEWIAAGRKEERFVAADIDGDGKITLDELKTGMSKMKARPATTPTGEQTPPAVH
jgi:hypothetical protein